MEKELQKCWEKLCERIIKRYMGGRIEKDSCDGGESYLQNKRMYEKVRDKDEWSEGFGEYAGMATTVLFWGKNYK